MKKYIAVAAAVLMFTACNSPKTPGGDSDESTVVIAESTSEETTVSSDVTVGDETTFYDPFLDESYTAPTLGTGMTVENEEELSIFKFNCTIPDDFMILEDSPEGKYYLSGDASIMIKSQNFKEQFLPIDKFSENAVANIVFGNMLYQCDTDVKDPVHTTVAGFDAVRYDYHITSYIYDYETDAEGNPVTDDKGDKVVKSKDIYNEFDNRAYFFYSDEDMFYVIFETPSVTAEKNAPVFDAFIDSITITPPGEKSNVPEQYIVAGTTPDQNTDVPVQEMPEYIDPENMPEETAVPERAALPDETEVPA